MVGEINAEMSVEPAFSVLLFCADSLHSCGIQNNARMKRTHKGIKSISEFLLEHEF